MDRLSERCKYTVDPLTGCWVWAGRPSSEGYGRIVIDRKDRLAHRVMYERLVGPIPAGLCIDHLCRNRICVNPEHLEPVTYAVNTRRGLTAKVTEAVVRTILESGDGAKEVAARFGLDVNHVYTIRSGRAWRDIRESIPQQPTGPTRAQKAAWAAVLRNAGWRTCEIALLAGVSGATVSGWLNDPDLARHKEMERRRREARKALA